MLITIEQDSLIQLISHEGFIEAFWEKTHTMSSYVEAYEALEEEYYRIFKTRRYSCYDSFRQVRDQITKKT